ncbi:transposable element Tc1 transposase [Trichonephila clavipes]|nr:transposable element Tc1 transposase [Trichonephila clavipes]
MLGMAKVEFDILLSGMTAIGRTMGSGRRGYGFSSGRKVLGFFYLGESLEAGSSTNLLKDLRVSSKEDFGKRNMPGKRARRHFSQLSEFERGLIIGMKTSGWSTRRVAGQGDRSECAVRNCWEHWTREGTPVRKTGSGATRKTTRREDRRIVWQALVDPTLTRSTIRADGGVAIVPQTISRYLAEANLKSKRPFRALILTPEHRQLRLQWCQARSMWNVTDWQKVVFSDESRFVLGTDDNCVRVWRWPGERYNSPSLFYVTLPAQLV